MGDHVRNLLGTYCERIDVGDLAGVGALFARGALAAGDGEPFVRGAEAVAAFYAGTVQLHDGSPRTKHLVVDTVLAEPDAEGVVVARSSYLVLQAVDGLPLQPIITGRYVDRVAPNADPADVPALVPGASGATAGGSSGGWHLVERRFHVDLVGDLTHHLARPDRLSG